MAKLNLKGQLLLPLVGISRKELSDYKVEVINIDFKYKEHSKRTKPYTLFIKIKSNVPFARYLKENKTVLKFYADGDFNYIMLECNPDHRDDWKVIVLGQYSKTTFRARELILKEMEVNKQKWLEIFSSTRELKVADIESKIKSKKYTPLEKREMAEEMLDSMDKPYELYPKFKKGYV